MLPLNRLGFFSSFEDQICPNGKLTVDINFSSDNNAIFRAGGDTGRYIITKMTLWFPRMVFNATGEQRFMSNYLKPHTWSYLREHLEISPVSQQRQGTFKISSSIRKPRRVYLGYEYS